MKAPATFIAALVGAALASTPALAQQDAEPLRVKTSDLNLETATGQAQLARRIDAAARKACGLDTVRTGTILRSTESRECFKQTKATATRQVAELASGSPQG